MGDRDIFRVITLNLWRTGGHKTRRLDVAALNLSALKPDAVCLQELWCDAASWLADAIGLEVATSGAMLTDPYNAVLTRNPAMVTECRSLPGTDQLGTTRHTALATLKSGSGRRWTVVSTHLAWGSEVESVRLDQARAIERCAALASGDSTWIVGGDLNALPASSTLRYLTGLCPHPSDGSSTLWLDAFDTAGTGPGDTNTPDNPNMTMSAEEWGFARPTLLPSRRIDYLLVRGYRYGKPGCPLAAKRICDEPTDTPEGPLLVSDHYGLMADFWDPPLVTEPK